MRVCIAITSNQEKLMKVNLLTEVTNLDGTAIPDADKSSLTVKAVLCNALTSQKPNEVIPGIEKVRRYNLAIAMYNLGEIDLNLDDTKLVRDLVADLYTPLIVGQIWNILDPELPAAEVAEPESTPDGIPYEPGTI